MLDLGKKNGTLYQMKPLAGLLMEDECLGTGLGWSSKQRRVCVAPWLAHGVIRVGK